MLTTAIEAKVAEWIEAHRHLEDSHGHRQVVPNGYLPRRTITTGIGPVEVRQPRAKKQSTQSGWPTRAKRPTTRSTRSWKRTARYAKGCECLAKDRDELLTFYDFPAEHWKHLRTTNPIESVFATVRLRHRSTEGNGSRARCLAMVHQLVLSASKRWRLLNGYDLLPDVIAGVQFTDGVKSQQDAA